MPRGSAYGARRLQSAAPIIWEAALDVLPLSTSANATQLRAALAAMGLTLTRASSATVQTSASTVVTSGIGVDDPRVGDAGYGRGLVIEESRTCVTPRSTALTTSPWVKVYGSETFASDATTAPDGTTDGDRIAAPGTLDAGTAYVYSGFTTQSYTASVWAQRNAGVNQSFRIRIPSTAGSSNQYSPTLTAGASWARSVLTAAVTAGTGTSSIVLGALASTAFDLFAWGGQLEAGKFATELIVTAGASATRTADKLTLANPSLAIRSGRLGLELRFIPKAAIADGPSFPILWNFDGNNQAYVRRVTSQVEVVIGGVTYVANAAAAAWTAGQTVDLWIEAGGGSLVTVVKYRINGGAAVTLGTSGAPQGNIGATKLDFFGPANELSAWVQRIRAYAPGQRPAWAA